MEWSLRHYQVTSKLGEGGMGEVFLATDTQLDRLVAIKLLPAAIAADPARRRRFLAEARAASALTHPNVCTIYEVGETEDHRPYIAMEYLRGSTLAELARQRPLTLHEILAFTAQIADALDAARELRMIHRDIKPANISINDRGQVKVLDFGLAKRFGETETIASTEETLLETQAGQLVGTPAYMSPEQALGRDLDHRSDLFSLGVVLYELTAGQRPFAGSSLGDTINRIVHHRPEPLCQAVPSAPPELERIVMKCLEKDPGRRYQTPRDLVLDLQNLQRKLDLAPTSASPSSVPLVPSILSVPSATPTPTTPEALPASDVFISFADADDKPLAAEQPGWITQFCRDLETRVEQMFGEPASIGHHSIPLPASANEQRLAEVLSKAKALISIVSPPFVKSPGCRREIELFTDLASRAGTLRVENKSRLLKVVKRPVNHAEWPPSLAAILPQLPGFDFFETDPSTGRLVEFDKSLGPLAKQRYHERMYDLAQEVCQVLHNQRQASTTPVTPADAAPQNKSGKTIFLAETTAELRAERDKLRRELAERGHLVVPDGPLPLESSELVARLSEWLRMADVTVHLFGSRYGVIPEGADASVPEIQLQLAQLKAKGIPKLVWLPAGVQALDPRQADLLGRLQTDPELHAQGEVIQGSLNGLKDLLLRRIDPPPKTNPSPPSVAAAGPPRVYLVCDAADEEEAAFIEDYLFDRGCEICLPLFTGSSGEIAEAHRRNLQTCDAVVIYYGTTASHWVDIKLLDLAQAPGYGRSHPFKAQAVFVPPSEDRRKMRFRTHLAEVLRADSKQSAEPLRPFVEKLLPK